MSVYHKDKPCDVRKAIESISVNQILKPSEIIIVVDGPIPKILNDVIRSMVEVIPVIRPIYLKENKGLGNALRMGLQVAKYEIIARMDSDDVSAPDRFAKQIAYINDHLDCDIVGGQITEFIDSESNIVGKRVVPCQHEEILMWLKARCPFNHMTVMMLRSRVIAVGNYLDWYFNEDYYLWIRMAEAGCRFANLPDVLVNVRVGKDMYARRGGWKYFRSEKGLQRYMLAHHLIGWPHYLFNITIRFLIQVIIPDRLRGFIFQKLFRE